MTLIHTPASQLHLQCAESLYAFSENQRLTKGRSRRRKVDRLDAQSQSQIFQVQKGTLNPKPPDLDRLACSLLGVSMNAKAPLACVPQGGQTTNFKTSSQSHLQADCHFVHCLARHCPIASRRGSRTGAASGGVCGAAGCGGVRGATCAAGCLR